MIVLEPVQAAIWNFLQNYMYTDAVFLAERLHAELKNEESTHLLATCYYRAGLVHQAYDVLSKTGLTKPRNKLLYARCCWSINKPQETEMALTGGKVKDFAAKNFDSLIEEFGDLSCFALSTLGEVFLKTERKPLGILALRKALSLNPFLFSTFQTICNAGEYPSPKEIFQVGTESLNTSMGATCWHPQIQSRFSANQSLQANQLSHLINGDLHSTPVPSATPMQEMNKAWLPPAPCKAKLNVGGGTGLSQPVTAGIPRKRQLELHTPMDSSRKPAFGALVVSETTQNSMLMSSSLMDSTFVGPVPSLNPKPPPLGHHQHFQTPPVTQQPQPSLNIKDLQQPPLRSNPLVVSQTGNLGGEKDKDSVDGRHSDLIPHGRTLVVHDVHQPPVKRSARLLPTNVTKENKVGAAKGRTMTRNAAAGSGAAGTLAGGSRRRGSTRVQLRQRAIISVDSENENKNSTGSSSDTVVTKQDPPPQQPSIELQNSKNLEKTQAALEEERKEFLELASAMQRQSASGLMSLLQVLGEAYIRLCRYECSEAIDVLSVLTEEQSETGWVLSLKGRAFFEMSLFVESVKMFQKVREFEPMRLDGLEYYSSALWQLQKEVALSSLSGALLEVSQHHYVPWVTLANCFSANQEHTSAIKYFQRALQLNHENSYVYVLLGQEFFLTEDLESAQGAFRNAVFVNGKDYRAWLGLGMVSYKQEQYRLAKVAYLKSLRMNPKGVIVLCHLGMCYIKLKEYQDAVEVLKKALDLNPRNPLAKYNLATAYMSMGSLNEAETLLLELAEETPKEAQVFFSLGQVLKKQGRESQSLIYISWAMDLDPKVGKPWKDRSTNSATNAINNDDNAGGDQPAAAAAAGDQAEVSMQHSGLDDSAPVNGPSTPASVDSPLSPV